MSSPTDTPRQSMAAVIQAAALPDFASRCPDIAKGPHAIPVDELRAPSTETSLESRATARRFSPLVLVVLYDCCTGQPPSGVTTLVCVSRCESC